jgi:hypothetical protein
MAEQLSTSRPVGRSVSDPIDPACCACSAGQEPAGGGALGVGGRRRRGELAKVGFVVGFETTIGLDHYRLC